MVLFPLLSLPSQLSAKYSYLLNILFSNLTRMCHSSLMKISFFFPLRIFTLSLSVRLVSVVGSPRRSLHPALLFRKVSDCFWTCFKWFRSSPPCRSPTSAPNCLRVSSSPHDAVRARQILTRTVSSGSESGIILRSSFRSLATSIVRDFIGRSSLGGEGTITNATTSNIVINNRLTVMKTNESITILFQYSASMTQ